MSSLKVISHYPTINSSGIFRNDTIRIYFDKPIEPSTINWDVFSLNDNYSFSTCVGDLSPIWASGINLSGVTSGLAFVPTITLLPNTEYSVYVFGAPNSVIAKDKSELQDTYSYTFITGTGYFDSTGSAGVPSGVLEEITYTDISGLTASEEASVSSFSVYSTNPKNQKPNVETQLSGVYITFTGNILTSNLSPYILVEENPVI